MKLSDAFYKAVNDGKVTRVRIMMEDSLLIDTTFESFNEMEKASKNMEGLYDTYDGKTFVLDKSLWTEDYMNTLMVEVINNFSHERIAHLKEVISYIYEPSDNIKNICNNIENRIKKELNIDINLNNFRLRKDINKKELKQLLMNRIKYKIIGGKNDL